MSSVVILAHATDSGAESVAAARWCSDSARRRCGSCGPKRSASRRGRIALIRPGVQRRACTPPGTEPIDDSRVAAVLNRIRYLPVPRFHRAPLKDRDYAGVEVQALVASWLAGLGDRVVHVVREHPWLTPLLPLQHWAAPAADYGLPVAARAVSSRLRSPRRSDPSTVAAAADAATVLVAGNRAGGPLADMFGPRCLRVARLLGFPLLEFGFIKEHGTTVLARVDPLPSLTWNRGRRP